MYYRRLCAIIMIMSLETKIKHRKIMDKEHLVSLLIRATRAYRV